MSRRHKKKHRDQGDVELNLAAMLDMAFQLLTFFILTFKPAPVEGQLVMQLPPPVAQTNVATNQSSSKNNEEPPPPAFDVVHLNLLSDANGTLREIQLEGQPVMKGQLTDAAKGLIKSRLNDLFGIAGSPYSQVQLNIERDLRYEEMMAVINLCMQQKLANGENLTKISFSELGGP